MTKIVRINQDNPEESIIKQVVSVLRKDGVIVYPTETAYGIGCAFSSEDGAQKIFIMKKRPEGMPLPVIMANKAMIERFVSYILDCAEKLIDSFMPGPLTLVLPMKKNIVRNISGEKQTIAFRISSLPAARRLSEELNEPVISTSANISGETEARKIEDVHHSIIDACDLVLDGGEIKSSGISTIVTFDQHMYNIIREGVILESEIRRVLKNGE